MMETSIRMAQFKIKSQIEIVEKAIAHGRPPQFERERARNFIEFALYTDLISNDEAIFFKGKIK